MHYWPGSADHAFFATPAVACQRLISCQYSLLDRQAFHGQGQTAQLGSPCPLLAVLVVLIAPGYGQAPVAPPPSDDQAISVGRWDAVAVDWDGKPVEPRNAAGECS
jgi:hypothetical protein